MYYSLFLIVLALFLPTHSSFATTLIIEPEVDGIIWAIGELDAFSSIHTNRWSAKLILDEKTGQSSENNNGSASSFEFLVVIVSIGFIYTYKRWKK
jgi:glucose uptake protein GlcU